MEHPIDNSHPGIAKCFEGDSLCEAYPLYMRSSPSGGCGNTCAPLRAFTNKQVSNLWVGGYTMAQTMMVNSALRMHPEEFAIGVGAGAAAAHMALSRGAVTSTEQAVTTPTVVAAIRSRILKHAPLSNKPPPRQWPAAVGVVCAEVHISLITPLQLATQLEVIRYKDQLIVRLSRYSEDVSKFRVEENSTTATRGRAVRTSLVNLWGLASGWLLLEPSPTSRPQMWSCSTRQVGSRRAPSTARC